MDSTIPMTWMILGALLLVGEVFTGTFDLLFFGIAALITAALAQWVTGQLEWQILVFASIAMLGFWYARRRGRQVKSKGFEADIDKTIVLSHPLKAGAEGTIQYQGAPWTAVNASNVDLSAGQKVAITKTEGVRIFVRQA